ncbi:MAG: sigma-70 family RNA polymerase sigma factor [Lachnospiraceae bacterium]|jgi:DNA-directed RNA polymerase specialized sigma24 family protein|nr:sigma-70 family RNA polymerase sigma factor [Lachnospiraceae bacterium]
MREWCKLLKDIKNNKDEFAKLIEYMNPLINKYVRLLYKDEAEDIREELILALWESVLKINYCNNDGECFSYINNALKNKFLELYRKSKKRHDFQ